MLRRYWTSNKRFLIVISAMVLCLCTLLAAPKVSYSAVQKVIQCALTAPTLCAFSGQTISIDITTVNISSQSLFIPWPAGTRHLLEWGVLSIAIEDEKGNRYKYVPVPGLFHPRQRSHYHKLTTGNKVSYNLNLCMFRDKNYSQSPCSRPGKYAVSATFSNSSAAYWDARTNIMAELKEVWTGKAMCNEINIYVVPKNESNRINQ